MPLLKREEWYDLGRDTNWTPRYVGEEDLFPEALSGAMGISADAWERWDEPYKMTFREYVEKTWLPSKHIELTTRAAYHSNLDKHFLPFFGDR